MRKNLLLLFFLIFTTCGIFSQSLVTAFPQLNAGGQINSVIEDSIANKVYVAGNFISIGGIARRNIARLNHNPVTNTYYVDAGWNPVTSMTGEIYSIAKYQNQVYIAGNFTAINGNSSFKYLRRIDTTAGSAVGSWSAGTIGPSAAINDIYVDGNFLLVAGTAIVYDDGADIRYTICAFNAGTGMVTGWNPNSHPDNTAMNWGSLEVVKIKAASTVVYMCGRNFGGLLNDGIVALDKNTGGVVSSFNPSFTHERVIDCEIFNNKVYIINSQTWPGGYSLLELDAGSGALTPGAFNIVSGAPCSIEKYKHYLFVSGTYQYLQTGAQNYIGSIDLSSPSLPYTPVVWNPVPNAAIDNRNGLKVIRNHLYVSDNLLTSISSVTRNGVALFCLEPYEPGSFSVYDLLVCKGSNNVTYTVSAPLYATGYLWDYTGTDVTINPVSNGTIQLNFGDNATSGNLQVVAASFCNLYSDTFSIGITVFPLPDANAGNDTTLTCIRTVLNLQGSSSSTGVTFSWQGPSGFTSAQAQPLISQPGTYILSVTKTFTGCVNRDTVVVSLDTVTPDVIMPSGSFELNCITDSLFLQGNTSVSLSQTYWHKTNTIFYSNPFYADTIGQYYFVVINAVNGCRDSSSLLVTENTLPPDIYLASHPAITGLIIDTITCIKDSVLVAGGSSAANTIFSWSDTTGVISYNDTTYILYEGAYDFSITDTSNGCISIHNFYVTEFLTPPSVIAPDSLFITCSVDSVMLNGTCFTLGCIFIWQDEAGTNYSDSSFVNETGTYFFTATRNDNGCSKTDSTIVAKVSLIETDIGNDTLVCKGSSVTYTVNVAGNFPVLTYQWFPGNGNSGTANFIADTTTWIWVIIEDTTGCSGADSAVVFIPSPIQDSILTFASCDSTTGVIQVYAAGGIPPYQYSADGGLNFQISNSFDVPFGNYDVQIMDSLGCLHFASATVNENSQLPEPFFLASTYNFVTDTIVLVDLSNPEPDSTEWIFPPEAHVLYSDSSFVFITFSDTGTYTISLEGFFSGCFSILSKTIYVRGEDSLYADFFNENGIKELKLYPNPNAGAFTVEVELYKKQNIVITINNVSGYNYFTQHFTESEYEFIPIQLSQAINGTYILRVISEFDSKHIYFIISGR